MNRRMTAATRMLGLLLMLAPSVCAQSVAHWTVDPTPVVRIGEIDGPDEYLLTNPLAGMVLADGTIVIQNSVRGLFEIRYYDGRGEYLRTASHWGQGPYEFNYLLGLHHLPGDSILAAGQDDRFAVFGPDGERVREGRMGMMPVLPVYLSRALDATHLAVVRSASDQRMPDPGIHRDEVTLMIFDFGSHAVDTVASVKGQRTNIEPEGNGVLFLTTPFSPDGFVAAGGGRLWVGDSQTPEIRGYGPDGGRPAVTIRVVREAREVSRTDERHMRKIFGGLFSGEFRQRWARWAEDMDFPDRMPFFGGLKVDRAGNLWVQRYETLWAEGPQHWDVFTRDGAPLAEVEVPATALPACARRPPSGCGAVTRGILEIGDDYLLVSQRDELGVMSVSEYRLHKGR